MRRHLWLLLLALTHGTNAAADGPPATSASAAVEVPLAELPTLPAIERPAPTPAATQALEARLDQLVGLNVQHPVEPRTDFGFLTSELGDDATPAIAQRLDQLRRSLDGSATLGLLERARKEGARSLDRGKKRGERSGASKRKEPSGAEDGASTTEAEGDWLQFALALRRPDDAAWRDLVELYGMLRMLEAIGTTPAVRELVNAYGYFGELVRIDLQRSIGRLKDKAVPALVEAREHDAKKVRDWARRTLETMGRAIPGEAVSTTDPVVLADVLLAFGRVKDIDAARVILSFVASERVQLRRAARQAIVALGEAAVWHLRDAYESVTGEKPPRSWDHRRLAQELFRVHDRSRMTAVFDLMEQGLDLAKKGRTAEAVAAFDQVLARAPLFERRKEMAPTYVLHAGELQKSDALADALVALRKAARLDPEAPDRGRVDSRIATLEGKWLAEKGTPDTFVLRRALELDPDNTEARDLLKALEERTVKVERATKRYVAVGGIGLVAILAMIWLARRRDAPTPPAASQEAGLANAAPDENSSADLSDAGELAPREGERSTEAGSEFLGAATSLLPELTATKAEPELHRPGSAAAASGRESTEDARPTLVDAPASPNVDAPGAP